MTQIRDTGRELRIDPDSVGGGYFKHAVYNHWDPYEDVDQSLLEQDRERIVESDAIGEAEFQELMPLVAETVSATDRVVNPMPLVNYAREKLTRRIEIITSEDAEIPDVEELVALDDGPTAAD